MQRWRELPKVSARRAGAYSSRSCCRFISPGVMAGAFYAFIVSFGDVPVAQFLVTGMLAVSSLVAVVSLLVIFGVQKLAGFDVISTGQGGKS
jgi:hypothetical protein